MEGWYNKIIKKILATYVDIKEIKRNKKLE